MTTTPLQLTPLGPYIGARVDGIDLSHPIDDALAETLQAVLTEHLVLVFPGQALSEDDQSRFAGAFGEVSRHLRPDDMRNKDEPAVHPAVMMVTNERKDGKPVGYLPDGEIFYHTASCFIETPQRAVCLYGMAVPETGGDTIFASACRMYDTLPADLKARLSGRNALNCSEFGISVKTVKKFDRAKPAHYSHPAIGIDPRDGRRFLYINELMTEEIDGLTEAETRETLKVVFAHIRTSPDDADWITRRCVPQPLKTFSQPVHLTGAWETVAKKMYLLAELHPNSSFDRFSEPLSEKPDWDVRSIAAGHDVMIDTPELLSEILLELA